MRPEINSIVVKKSSKKEVAVRSLASIVVLSSAFLGEGSYKKVEAKGYSTSNDIPSVDSLLNVVHFPIYGPIPPTTEQITLQAGQEFAIGLENARKAEEQKAAELEKQKQEQEGVQEVVEIAAPQEAQVIAQSVTSGVPSGKIRVETETPTVWQILSDCETGDGQVGPPFYVTWDSNGSFEGAFQFLNSTWKSLQSSVGYEHAYQAPPEIQLQAAVELQIRGGWGQWPGCTERMREEGYIK